MDSVSGAPRGDEKHYVDFGMNVYREYWLEAEHPKLRDALEEALLAVVRMVADDYY